MGISLLLLVLLDEMGRYEEGDAAAQVLIWDVCRCRRPDCEACHCEWTREYTGKFAERLPCLSALSALNIWMVCTVSKQVIMPS